MFDANSAAPTSGHDSDRPARKNTFPVIFIRRTDNRPTVNMPHMYRRMIAISRGGSVRVCCIGEFNPGIGYANLIGTYYFGICAGESMLSVNEAV
jgi:hypothetical protein